MSSEESYRAILRYLTDERQPYAPGTPGNDKRKIRKAAACYVARGGTLYYQRRQRGRQRFCELEVVLPPSRRRGLIRAAHQPAPGARHRTRRHTWQQLSQRYWWRGILKEVKDYIKQCDTCQEKNDRSRPLSDPTDMLEELGIEVHTCGDSNDTDEELSNPSSILHPAPKETKRRLIEKHELVFVDSKGSVKQASSKHSQAVLTQLNQQRLSNQFCDVTLLIEGEEYKAHKSVLAASSDYFRELFIEKGAVSSHEAVVDLSGFCKSSFLPLLEFAYTSVLTFDFCSMAEVAMLARHLFMSEVLEICEHVHKQMESKQLTVYQKGGTQTVESSKCLLDANGDAIPDFTHEVAHIESHKAVNGQAQDMAIETQEAPQYETELITEQSTELLDQPTVDSALQTFDAGSNDHESTPVDSSTELHVLLVQPDVRACEVRSAEINILGLHPDTRSTNNESADSLCGIHTDLQQSVTNPVQSNVLLAQPTVEPNVTGPTKIDVSSRLPDLQQNMISASEITCGVNSDLQPSVTSPNERNASSVQCDGEQSRSIPEFISISNVATELAPIAGIPEEVDAYVEPSVITETVSREVNVSDVPAGVPENVVNPIGVIVSDVHSVPTNTLASGTGPSVVYPETSDVVADICSPVTHSTSLNASTEAIEDVEEIPTLKLGSSSDDHCMDTSIEMADSSPEAVDDTYKSRLRQRSVGEGGYIHLHQGLERKLQNRKTNPKSAVQQVAMKLVQRGRKLKLPKRERAETQEEHECSECGLIFQRRYALIMHTLKHERTKEYKCPLCKKEFQYSASLRAHLIRHAHRSEEPASPANTLEGPAAETTKGRTKREFICDICGRTLPKLYSLRIHMLKHTGVKPHACKVCGKTFTYKHGLKMHRILHEINKQFKCELCEKSFVTKRSLQEHTSLHTGESKYLCSICGKSFHRASGLSKHVKKHQPKPETRRFQCTQCDKSFFEARDLRQHMNKHLGVKPFQCQFCGKCYSWKKDWYSHVKSHSVTDPYRCNVCGKEFFEKALFRRHVKKATHGKKGRAKQNLQRVCEHCGRKFTQLREFRRHMNNHEGQYEASKPFECLTCGVAWADARSLKRHVRTHTGERPYVCPVCHDAHIDARTLRKHMTKYHGDYVPCKIMLEKDTLQFHNQGTQVEHAISIISTDIQEQESEIIPEDVETVLVTGGETLETIETVPDTEECTAVSTLSDQSIMQVVNYVLAQQQGQKVEVSETVETVEVEVAQVSDTE